MPQASLNALMVAYRNQADWLLAQAKEFESGTRKVTGLMRGKEVDLTDNLAAEYLHKARNLVAIIEIYERLHPPAEASARTATVSPLLTPQSGPQT
jgi:hypothetical protein